jgi:hypothetical protein
MLRALLFSAVLTSLPAVAQAEPAWIPAPMPTPAPLPGPPPGPLPTDPVRTGIQFHAEIQGGPNGFGPSASVGLGFNRVAILLTPGLALSSGTNSVSLGLAARIYFKQRQMGALVGFIRPEALVGSIGSTFLGSGQLFGGIGVGGGGEYLLTRNLGFTAELGLRYLSAGNALTTVFSLGIMLHQ